MIRPNGNLRGWTLKSVSIGDRDVTDTPIEVRSGESIANIAIVFTDKLTEINGSVTTSQGAPIPEYTVLAFPTDPSLWRPQARQIILHGHIRVNGKKVSIPSYQVDAGDVIEPAKKDRSLKIVKESLLMKKDQQIPSWLKLAEEQSTGSVVTLPTAQELQVPVESQLIVEYMSR